jgi:hypothetical protein
LLLAAVSDRGKSVGVLEIMRADFQTDRKKEAHLVTSGPKVNDSLGSARIA